MASAKGGLSSTVPKRSCKTEGKKYYSYYMSLRVMGSVTIPGTRQRCLTGFDEVTFTMTAVALLL